MFRSSDLGVELGLVLGLGLGSGLGFTVCSRIQLQLK